MTLARFTSLYDKPVIVNMTRVTYAHATEAATYNNDGSFNADVQCTKIWFGEDDYVLVKNTLDDVWSYRHV